MPVDIWINGRFHTTVLSGAFSEALLCPGPHSLALAGQGTQGPGSRQMNALSLRPQQTSYLLIQSQGTTPSLTPLSAEQALSVLGPLRRQNHTLSRLPTSPQCPGLPPAAPMVADTGASPPSPPILPVASPTSAPTRYTLSAEMLFNFSGSRPQHLSEQGQAQIVRLGKRIREQLRPGQIVMVQGHTDPMGPAALNQRLSLERAQTVGRILVNSGIPARQVRTEGLGSTQLLVKDCLREARTRDDKLNCNRPNRRVEISVSAPKN